MLVSGMAFAKRAPASASSHSPADLAAFPDAGKGWVELGVNYQKTTLKNGDKVTGSGFGILPNVTYAFNNQFAITGGIGYLNAKEPGPSPKDKITGITNPVIGVIYRALDKGQALNIGLAISPTIGKQTVKQDGDHDKFSAISGQNVVNFGIEYAQPVGPVVLGAEAGITYGSDKKTKGKGVYDGLEETIKSAVAFNAGIAVQYKGINKLALTAGFDWNRIPKTESKDVGVQNKAYNQFGLNLEANYNVANNFYVGVNYGHKFNAQVKDGDGDKLYKTSNNSVGLAGTIQF